MSVLDEYCVLYSTCGFPQKEVMDKDELIYYSENCMRKGEHCGLKIHYDKMRFILDQDK